MKLRKLDIKITDAIRKMGGVFHGMFIDGYNRTASEIAGCIHTRINDGNYWFVIEMENETKIKIVGKWSPNSESNGNVYDTDGLSPTLTCGAHGGCEPRIKEKKADVRNTAIAEMIVSGEIPTDKVTMFDTRHRTVSENGLCLTCQTDKCAQQFVNAPISTDFRIRKLTERECFRLMGVREDDIDKLLKAGISKTQLYKLAGNSIVCDVLMAIFDKMLVNTKAEKGQQLSLF
jgi:site-specific DNA-cytosine methylase